MTTQTKKILIYSHDTFGLGNIRRMLAIAKHLAESDPNVSVLVLTGSPMLHAFRIPPRVDYVKLPCLARNGNGDYHVKYLDMGYESLIQLRANIILSTVLDFQPDLLMVDKKPFGVSNELRPALDLLQRRGSRTRLVLLLRDILDSPKATIETWEKNHYHNAIEAFYDLVLVAGSRKIFDLTQEYRFPSASREKVRFCGYIERERGTQPRQAYRNKLGVVDDPLVLVCAGGGADGYKILSSYLDGLQDLAAKPSMHTVLVCGPEMSKDNRARVMAKAEHCPKVAVKEFTDDMMSYVEAADLVVCMGGYNTICEILTLRKHAIVVPRVKPVKEQWIRANRMAKLGLLWTIHPDELSPAGLIEAVTEKLRLDNVHASGLYQVDLKGLSRITSWVNSVMDDEAVWHESEAVSQGAL